MPLFTCITDNRESTHLSQHDAPNAIDAIRIHIGRLPHDDGDDVPELDWLLSIANDETAIELLSVGDCKNTWLWADGLKCDPKYFTHIVQTDPSVRTGGTAS